MSDRQPLQITGNWPRTRGDRGESRDCLRSGDAGGTTSGARIHWLPFLKCRNPYKTL